MLIIFSTVSISYIIFFKQITRNVEKYFSSKNTIQKFITIITIDINANIYIIRGLSILFIGTHFFETKKFISEQIDMTK